jgi:mono/diheme cytochrome c family protein
MSRPIRVILVCIAASAVAIFAAACGTEKISVAQNDPTHQGAVLFSQRCSGCHTLSYAATHGSAANPRTAQANNGPNFDVRCERPVTRVLYAIENGGFSGAIMPQNIVVGSDARQVAEFVSKYAGQQAPKIPGVAPCDAQPIGTLPAAGQSLIAANPSATGQNASSGTAAAAAAAKSHSSHTNSSSRTNSKNSASKSGGKNAKTTTQTTTTTTTKH